MLKYIEESIRQEIKDGRQVFVICPRIEKKENDESSWSEVKAVKTGVLYRGAFTVRSGCQLRYVKVKHAEANIETYYFHVNY